MQPQLYNEKPTQKVGFNSSNQEDPEGPWSLTCETSQKVTVDPVFTPKAQFEN